MTVDTDLFDTAPPPPSGLPFWQPKQHESQLMLFEVDYVEKDTSFGNESDHVFGTVHAITGPEAGNSFTLKLPNKKLVAQLKGKCGKRVAGRVAKKASKSGGNAAWVIETDLSDIDRKLVTDFIAKQVAADEEPPF